MKQNNQNFNYRFPVWLTVIFFTLFSIPVLIYYNNITLAKVAGVLTVILTSIALRYWMRIARLKSGSSYRVILSKNDVFDMKRKYKFINELSASKLIELKDRVGVVLSQAKFIDKNGKHYSKAESIHISLYIALDENINLEAFKNFIFINDLQSNVVIIQQSTIINYPLDIVLNDFSICTFDLDQINTRVSSMEFNSFIINRTK